MSNLDFENKKWLAAKLDAGGHGVRTKVADATGVTTTQLSRMANVDPKAPPKNTQNIPLPKLREFAKYFNDTPPGLLIAHTREIQPPAPARSRELQRVPLLERVTAGRLKMPVSQLPPDEIKWMTFSGLGHGEFIALKVEDDADSMDRISPPGSIIVVNKADTDLKSGRYYIFEIAGKTTYKMWQAGPPSYLAPYSTNPTHKPQFIKRKSDFEVIGRVKRTLLDL